MQQQIYKSIDGHELTADIFLPEGEAMARPCIGCFHGGGWGFGKPAEYHEICRVFAAAGYVAISFSYRLSSNPDGSYPHPTITPVEATLDARDALRWLHEQADGLGIDPERIALCGQSAGGQLAIGSVLFDAIDPLGPITPRPAAFIFYSSNHNTVEAWMDNLLGERRAEIWSISPYHNLIAGIPPIVSFHGGEDPMVPKYIVDLFMERSKALGNRYDLHFFPERGHYLGAPDETYATLVDLPIIEETLAFLREIGLR